MSSNQSQTLADIVAALPESHAARREFEAIILAAEILFATVTVESDPPKIICPSALEEPLRGLYRAVKARALATPPDKEKTDHE